MRGRMSISGCQDIGARKLVLQASKMLSLPVAVQNKIRALINQKNTGLSLGTFYEDHCCKDKGLGGPPHPVVATIRDKHDHVKVLLHSYHTTTEEWGGPPMYGSVLYREPTVSMSPASNHEGPVRPT